jgi:hypothetical protein
MAEFNSPEPVYRRKHLVRVIHSPQPSPASTPIASAVRLTTSRSLSTTHLPVVPSPIYRTVVRNRPVIIDSDTEGGSSPFAVSDGGTCSAGRSVGHSERSALGDLRGWGFQPLAEPSRLGQATTKRQLHLGGTSEPCELNGRLGAASAQHIPRPQSPETTRSDGEPNIAREAEGIADRLLSNLETSDEGHILQNLLPSFKDGSRGYADLLPFLSYTLEDAHPSVRSHPLDVDDDASPLWHVPNHKAHTRNVTEEAKNTILKCPVIRDADVLAIKSMSTDKCKCESHRTVTLDAVKELRHERSQLSATGKRDQLNDLVENLVRKNNKGKRTLKGKVALGGVPLCAKVWQAILKVHQCSV